MNQKAKCLNPSCERPSKVRGLCGACYAAAFNMVKFGHTTWGELESLGKVNPRSLAYHAKKWLRDGLAQQPSLFRATEKREATSDIDFETLDWALSNSQLARQIGCNIQDLRAVRFKLGKPVHQHKMRVLDRELLKCVDWVNKNDMEISREFNVSRERIRQIRLQDRYPACKFHRKNKPYIQIVQWLEERRDELKGKLSREVVEAIPFEASITVKYKAMKASGLDLDWKSSSRRLGGWLSKVANWDLPNKILEMIWAVQFVGGKRCYEIAPHEKWSVRFGMDKHPELRSDPEFLEAIRVEIGKAREMGKCNDEQERKVWEYLGVNDEKELVAV